VVQAETPVQILVVTRLETPADAVTAVAAARVAESDMGKQVAGPRDLLVVVLITALVVGVVYGLNESLHLHLQPFTVYCIVVLVTLTVVWISKRIMKNEKPDA